MLIRKYQMLDANIKQSINESILCWLATVDEDGQPSVSPKEMFVSCGNEHVLIANIASPRSVSNIQLNPLVCVSFVHVFKQKGFKLTGKAKIIEQSNPQYEPYLVELQKIGGENFPVKSIIEINVKATEPITAPSYWMFSETTEKSQVGNAMETYGVIPKK